MSSPSVKRAASAPRVCCALSIAGFDPSGGAGIAADLRAFAACGVWGCAAVSVVTVQSTAGLVSVCPLSSALVVDQVREVLAHQRVRAIKTGALGSAEIVRAVCAVARDHPKLPWVLDPVMVATHSPSGARLLDSQALAALRDALSLVTVATPNVDEASALLGSDIRNANDMVDAAAELQRRFGSHAVLLKGGHLQQGPALDVLAFRNRIDRLTARRQNVPALHGGGCTLAALIAGKLARAARPRDPTVIREAVGFAKRRVTQAIARATVVGDGLAVLPVGYRSVVMT